MKAVSSPTPSFKSEEKIDQFAIIETASLELTQVSLAEKIQQFAHQVITMGICNLKIIPLFLFPGVHVTEDIPKEVAIAQQVLGETITLELCPYLGSYEGLTDILSRQFSQEPTAGRVLLAHGSRRPGGNHPVNVMAAYLKARVAYWSVKPSLPEQIDALVKEGAETIAIMPYFLFNGGITTAIADQVQQLQQTFPQVQLRLGNTLGATPELARVIIEAIEKNRLL